VLRGLDRHRPPHGEATPDARARMRVVPADTRTVVLEGEIDVSRVIEAERVIRSAEREAGHLVLDLRAVSLLDSTALNLISDTAHRARERDARVTVMVDHPLVRRVLRMMFFDELVDVQPPLNAADDRDGPFPPH
jgi:anti-anti-sigma factor